jgi:hypothetical protein
MRNPQYVLNEVEKSKFDIIYTKAIGNEFTLTPDNTKEFSDYYNVFGKEVIISGDKGKVTFNITNGDNKLDLSIVIAEQVSKFEVKLASLIMKVLGTIGNNDVKVSINDGAPAILLSTSTAEYKVNYIVAPLVK